MPTLPSHFPGLQLRIASRSASGQVSPWRSSGRGGVEKRPISGISGTLRNSCRSRARSTSVSIEPLTLTTPKAAISAFSVVVSCFVTTSPRSIAWSCPSLSWITLRRNGRGGGSGACARAMLPAAKLAKQTRWKDIRDIDRLLICRLEILQRGRIESLPISEVLMRAGLIIVMASAFGAAGTAVEPPPTFQASKILTPKQVKGPNHTVSDQVKTEGYYQVFHIVSPFGEIDAEGRTVLATRLVEVDALAQLSEVSKGEVFAKAAGGAVLSVGKGVASVVTDPGATAENLGAGVKRFGTNLGRKAKRTADSATKDDKKADDAGQSQAAKAAGAGGKASSSVLGVNKSARKWAQKLGVYPYTTNPVLHKALVDIGKIDSAGSIAVKVAVPIPPVVTTTASVGNLVWGADPEQVRKVNEKGLTELGVPAEVAGRFFRNANYTITNQTRFVAALGAVKVKGCADYVDAASEANEEREALFFVESAELLAGLHKASPVTAVLEDSRALVARMGDRAVALLPFDYLRWTEALQKAAGEIGGRAKAELGAKVLEVRIAGKVSEGARAGLAEAGWQVKEGVSEGLSVKPAD